MLWVIFLSSEYGTFQPLFLICKMKITVYSLQGYFEAKQNEDNKALCLFKKYEFSYK